MRFRNKANGRYTIFDNMDDMFYDLVSANCTCSEKRDILDPKDNTYKCFCCIAKNNVDVISTRDKLSIIEGFGYEVENSDIMYNDECAAGVENATSGECKSLVEYKAKKKEFNSKIFAIAFFFIMLAAVILKYFHLV